MNHPIGLYIFLKSTPLAQLHDFELLLKMVQINVIKSMKFQPRDFITGNISEYDLSNPNSF